jgi:transcription elongation factor GreA
MGPPPDGRGVGGRARSQLSVLPVPDREELEVSALSEVRVDDDLVVTAYGYEQLSAELEGLRTIDRPALSEQLRVLRADGDAESPALFELLEEQAQLERRIGLLEAQVDAARVVAPARDGNAAIGSRVRVRHSGSGEVADYDLVGSIEPDVGNGRVSISAPVGRALAGRRTGETVVVETPRDRQELEILAVSPTPGR